MDSNTYVASALVNEPSSQPLKQHSFLCAYVCECVNTHMQCYACGGQRRTCGVGLVPPSQHGGSQGSNFNSLINLKNPQIVLLNIMISLIFITCTIGGYLAHFCHDDNRTHSFVKQFYLKEWVFFENGNYLILETNNYASIMS